MQIIVDGLFADLFHADDTELKTLLQDAPFAFHTLDDRRVFCTPDQATRLHAAAERLTSVWFWQADEPATDAARRTALNLRHFARP
jgi:hypothetical protein